MADVFIVNGLRTYIGLKNKAYRKVPAENLAAEVLRAIKTKNAEKNIQEELVISGNCTGTGGNISRLSLLKAGFCDEIPGITIDAQCASGLESIIAGFARIRAGLNSVVVAGGTESASTAPSRAYSPNHPNFDGTRTDNSYYSSQFIPEDFSENSMIRGADEVCRKYGFTNEDMVKIVLESHKNAHLAQENNDLSSIIHSVFNLSKDEAIRKNMTENFVSRLKPVLPDGIINPATSCLFNDGAAFLTLCDEANAQNFSSGVFKICDCVTSGSSRFLSPEACVSTIEKLISKSGIPEEKIDRIDFNQAFACIDLLYKKRFSKPSNCFGGALAYGHPYGASGAIVTLHLMCAMEKFNERYGIACVPAAGGIASAILIERIR